MSVTIVTTAAGLQEALEKWLAGCQEIINAYYKNHFQNLTPCTLEVEDGRRYVRIIRVDHPGSGRSAHAFIDKTNGDVLKPATWKAPAKHARGNLFDEWGGLHYMGPYGPAYLR